MKLVATFALALLCGVAEAANPREKSWPPTSANSPSNVEIRPTSRSNSQQVRTELERESNKDRKCNLCRQSFGLS